MTMSEWTRRRRALALLLIGIGLVGTPSAARARQVDADSTICVPVEGADPGSMAFVNLTNTGAAGPGYGTVRSSDATPTPDRSEAEQISSVNFIDGVPPNPNLAPARLGADGRICYDASVAAHDVILDQLAMVDGDALSDVSPRRLLDTRNGAPLAAGQSVCSLVVDEPTDNLAAGDLAIVNITPTRAAATGYGSLRSSDDPPVPDRAELDRFSSVNFTDGTAPNPNLAVTAVGSDGSICYDGSIAEHDVALDLVAGIRSNSAPAIEPLRVLDTRSDARVVPETSRCVALTDPDAASTDPALAPGDLAIVNITPTRAVGAGYGSLRSSDSAPMSSLTAAERFSSVNFASGAPPDPNLSVAVVGADGRVCYDGAGAEHDVILDLVGAISGGAVGTTPPRRLVDTRSTSPSCTSPLELDSAAMTNGSLRRFSDDEFQRLVDLTSTARIQTGAAPSITGDAVADARIRAIAEARGYRLRSDIGAAGLVAAGAYRLEPAAAAALSALQRSARSAGYWIQVGSGYRSITRQRTIFRSKLNARGVGTASIRAGGSDATIDSILRYSSIPGYSRHHTGTTVDLTSGGGGINSFGATAAYRWMAADNFAEAKRHGFVPSYPAGAGLQGPLPEAWEFIYVGVATLLESPEFGEVDGFTITDDRLAVTGSFGRPDQVIEVFVDDGRVAEAIAECVESGAPGRFELAASVAAPLDAGADVCVVAGNESTSRLLRCLQR